MMDVPVGTEFRSGLGWAFFTPCRPGNDAWALVPETGTSTMYTGARRSDPMDERLSRSLG